MERSSNPVPEGELPKSETTATTMTNGTSKPSAADGPAEEKKLSGAELKKQQKAEKAAKRAQKKSEGAPPQAPPPVASKPAKKAQQQPGAKGGPVKATAKEAPKGEGKEQSTIPVRTRRLSKEAPAVKPVKAPSNKQVSLFGHLYGQPRRYGIEGAMKEVHPAILALGLQMSNYEVCGSTARCVAMLLAFKSAIQSYHTPQGTALARHFIPHYLSPQIDYLKSCRPISITMGNAIRALKDAIANVDPSTPDDVAKRDLCTFIDIFLRERITAADELIAETASNKIEEDDVVVVYAKSSLVLKTLLLAKEQGKKFRVIVLDSKPLFEGKRMAMDLANADIPVQYSLIPAASHAVAEATKVFLGAHAMMANGSLYSRVGTAIVAMLARPRKIPVIVCAESLKFTDRVTLDSIVNNEVGPPDELLGGIVGAELKRWGDTPNLQVLNILYDNTPADMVNMVVTEFGSLPPSSVPAVLRILEDASSAGVGR
ncbi:IF-2B-domain-containing protein [Tothia fuscella]|uniref:Translation initiation factor eIF2B subunit delta n=1 Tax=Tothia fuscella TaxID=1048955 RepID=A0A9P4NKX7_9PEZI|nr:IF-2B-domain-containing protein [Tothia fuscella]